MEINFSKYGDGLAPAIVQDARTGRVLMLGFMNAEALELTRSAGKVTFYSRSRQTLWTKGETSGNYLAVNDILVDCDSDTLLIKATPAGPVCHTGAETCFQEPNKSIGPLFDLENTIADRRQNAPAGSYTAELFASGLNRIAQKVGEEAVEVIIASKDTDRTALCRETADLLYHLLVLLAEKEVSLDEVLETLVRRKR